MTIATPSRLGPPPPGGHRARRVTPAAGGARTIDPFRLLRRHMALLICTAMVGVFLGAVAFILLKKFSPLYSGEVLFEIRAGLNEARDVGQQDITQSDLVSRLASTETMLLISRPVLETAVKQPDVQTTAWFQHNHTENGVAMIDDAVDELEDDLARRLISGTNLFGLGWSTASPSDVPVVLNSIGRAYLAERKRLDEMIYNNNLDVFRSELAQTVRELDDLEHQIDDFIRSKGITTLDDPRSTQLALSVQDLQKRMAETKSGISFTQTMYAQTAAKLEGTIEPSDEDRRAAAENPALRPHELQLMSQRTELRTLREQYRTDDNFLVRKAESRLRALDSEYESKIAEIMRDNLHAQLKSYSDTLERYQKLFDQQTAEYEERNGMLRTLAADMSKYLQFKDQQNHLSTSRDADVDLIREVRLMRLRSDASRVRMAQEAIVSREVSFPKIALVVPATAVILLGLVTGLVFLREITDQRVKTASDIMLLPDARILGVIPELAEDPCRSQSAELVVRRSPQSVLAESYRQAGALIDKAMSRLGHQTLLVVGGLPGAGTTTVVTNLAAAAAAAGRSVVVVDANFRRPSLSEAMGLISEQPGLGDILMERAELDEVIQLADDGINVITAGRPANRVYERFNNGQLERLLAELRRRFELVLIDCPPAVVAGDALVLANKVDAAVLVVRAYQEQRGLVARLINQLVDANCELLGVVLNRPRGTAGGYFKKNFAAMASYASAQPAAAAGSRSQPSPGPGGEGHAGQTE